MPFHSLDPSQLSPDEIRAEISSLLARGLRSLRDRGGLSHSTPCISARESSTNRLDVPARSRLNGTPVNAPKTEVTNG